MEIKMDVRRWTVIVPKTDIGIHTVVLRDLIRKQELCIYIAEALLGKTIKRRMSDSMI